jgi:hypothetical protein
MEMSISQAIRKVKDLKGRIAKHQQNAVGAVSYAVKEPPAYAFRAELEMVDTLGKELVRIQTAIAVANATTQVEWQGQKVRLAWAVRRLEEIKGRIAWYAGLHVHAQAESTVESWDYQDVGDKVERVKTEKKMKCDLPQVERDKVAAGLQDEFNKLNDVVETINHRTSVSLD